MRRRSDIYALYVQTRRQYPEAFIAIQTGAFFRFLGEQAEEIALLTGEPISCTDGLRAVVIPADNFAAFVERLRQKKDRPLHWLDPVDISFAPDSEV